MKRSNLFKVSAVLSPLVISAMFSVSAVATPKGNVTITDINPDGTKTEVITYKQLQEESLKRQKAIMAKSEEVAKQQAKAELTSFKPEIEVPKLDIKVQVQAPTFSPKEVAMMAQSQEDALKMAEKEAQKLKKQRTVSSLPEVEDIDGLNTGMISGDATAQELANQEALLRDQIKKDQAKKDLNAEGPKAQTELANFDDLDLDGEINIGMIKGATKAQKKAAQEALLRDKQKEVAQVEEAQVEVAQVEEAQVEVAQAEEAQVEVAQVEEAQVEEAQVEEAQVEEAQVEEAQVEVAQVEEAQVEEAQVEVAQTETTQEAVLVKIEEIEGDATALLQQTIDNKESKDVLEGSIADAKATIEKIEAQLEVLEIDAQDEKAMMESKLNTAKADLKNAETILAQRDENSQKLKEVKVDMNKAYCELRNDYESVTKQVENFQGNILGQINKNMEMMMQLFMMQNLGSTGPQFNPGFTQYGKYLNEAAQGNTMGLKHLSLVDAFAAKSLGNVNIYNVGGNLVTGDYTQTLTGNRSSLDYGLNAQPRNYASIPFGFNFEGNSNQARENNFKQLESQNSQAFQRGLGQTYGQVQMPQQSNPAPVIPTVQAPAATSQDIMQALTTKQQPTMI